MDFPCPQHVLQGREQRTQGAWGGEGEGASQSMPVIIATHKQVKGVVGNRAPESRPIRPLRPAPPPVCVHFVGWKSSDLSLLLASLLTLSHLDEFTRLTGPPAPPLSDERASSRATPLWVSEALAIKWCRADGSRGHTGRWTIPRLPHGPALSPASPAASLPVTLSVSSVEARSAVTGRTLRSRGSWPRSETSSRLGTRLGRCSRGVPPAIAYSRSPRNPPPQKKGSSA